VARGARPIAAPVAGAPPRERADAARNRAKILAAARRLRAERGIENVSIDAVAAAAGVGRGNVFRRFGDRAGLAEALLDEQERDLQERILRGPPPLGPGAPPQDRLTAFTEALLGLLDAHGDLLLVTESGRSGARYRTGAYAAWRHHVAILVAQARPDLDEVMAAEVLLAPLSAELHRRMSAEEGLSVDALQRTLGDLIERWLGVSGPS
jgi:AcrR family transcriptional regulator